MRKKQKVNDIIMLLDEHYGTDVVCYLEHRNAWQLLVATILSAQCTDARVNIVTKELFERFPMPQDMAGASQDELERLIHSTGFYHNKAKNLIACAKELLHTHNGIVPDTMEALTLLPGVGRKTANVILGNIYGKESIVVDTHVKRISKKLGLTKEEDPEKIEYDLMRVLPRDHWILFNIQIIAHGRSICTARQPKCTECFMKEQCEWWKHQNFS